MPQEVIFCIDMQHNYASRFSGGPKGFEDACHEVTKFSSTLLQEGLPTWTFYYHHSSEAGGEKDIERQHGSPVFFKNASSAFDNPNLLPELEKQGVKKIYMVGCYMNDCVAATAVAAALKGFEVVMVQGLVFDSCGGSDVHASWSSEDIQQSIMQAFRWTFDYEYFPHFSDHIDGMLYWEKGKARNAASQYIDQVNKAFCVFRRFDSLRIQHEMQISQHPRYLAVQSIAVQNKEEVLHAFAHRPLLREQDTLDVGPIYS